MNTIITAIRYTALATVISVVACGAANAGAMAGARIGDVHLGVIDLTPGDGHAAGFDIQSFDSRLIAYTDTRATGGTFDQQVVHPAPGNAASANTGSGAVSATAGTSGAFGDVTAGGATAAAFGLDNSVSGESEQRLWLTLKPHSLLTVSGNVLTEAYRTLLPGEGYRVFTWASVDISDADMMTTSLLSRESALIWGEATAAARHEEAFMLAFANAGAVDMAVSMNFLAYAEIAVTAVPEPGMWAMLGAGLLLMATRRRSNA